MATLNASVVVGLLCILACTQLVATSTQPGDIDGIDIQLVNGRTRNEGRVLVRLLREEPWNAVCFQPDFSHAVRFQMCRRLGFPFACGQDYAGTRRTDDASLGNVTSKAFRVTCEVEQYDRSGGGCNMAAMRALDPSLGPACSHDQDMWLSCGYAGMSDFELRLAEGSYQDPAGLLQGRCGAEFEWSAVCGNSPQFHPLKQGRVACRELGYADHAVSVGDPKLRDLDVQHRPNYTLFVDIGCIGNETSLTECQHYSLRECTSYVTLECFTGVYDYGRSPAYLCGSKQLCSDQCQQLHPIVNSSDDVFHYCQCDDACTLFGDCCYDHPSVCDRDIPSLQRAEFTTEDFDCVGLPGSQFTHIGYVIISRCPISWRDQTTRDLCEKPVDIDDVLGSLPLYDDQGVDFKNFYCALCNGRSLNMLSRWDMSNVDKERTITETRYYPGLNATLPTRGWLVTPPRGQRPVRECPAHLVDTCKEEFRGTEVERGCKGYYAPVKTENTDTRYRNPHCAMCNGKTAPPYLSCRDQRCTESCAPYPWGPCQGVCGPYGGFLTIEVLFDFTSTRSLTGVSCPDGHIYDPFLDKCRVLTCASGYQIEGDECVVAPSIAPIPTNQSHPEVVECLSILFSPDLKPDNILVSLDPVADTTYSAYFLVSSADEAGAAEEAIDVAVEMIAKSSSSNTPLPCNVSSLSILQQFSFNGSSTCNDFKLRSETMLPGFPDSMLTVVIFKVASDDQLYTKEKVSPLCLKINDLNCSSLLTLDETEYRVLPKDNIQIKVSKANLSYGEHVRFPDGTVVVCSFISPTPETLEQQIRRAISFIGSLVSLLALAATFVTYSIFPELRNVAGICTMNLVGALFTAILMFLLAGFFGASQAACVFGAVVAHFAWMAAFLWMTMVSFNVAHTLTSMVPRSGRSAGISRALVIYSCLAWGVPLGIVIICLILQFCGCIGPPAIYAQGNLCWITDLTARIVAFAVPMILSLVCSVSFYIFAMVSFRRTRQGTKLVRNRSPQEEAKEELAIYAKVSTVVGVTWLFGFISQSVTGIVVFSYIYIILNYLQGLFIFISFCLNKRVRGLWRVKMGQHKKKPQKDTTSGTPLKKDSVDSTLNSQTVDTKM